MFLFEVFFLQGVCFVPPERFFSVSERCFGVKRVFYFFEVEFFSFEFIFFGCFFSLDLFLGKLCFPVY